MEGAEGELAAIILEYLMNRGYLQTVASFQTELQCRPQQAPPTQTAGLQREFIVAFECGERAVFFELWNQNVPQVTLERDPTCQDLEFQLSVYFAIYPIKTGVGDKTRSMQDFTEYLGARSAILAKSPDLTPYCALPYVPDPTTHPSFKKLFTESWNSELKSRLIHFLRLSLKDTPSQPKLLSLYLMNKVSLTTEACAQEVISLREQLSECRKQCSQRLAEIQASYHTLVGIAMELLDTLESAIAGRTITPESIQSICSRLFGGSLPATVATGDVRPATAASILRQSVMSLRESVQAPINVPTSTPLPEAHSSPLSPPHTLTNSLPNSPSPLKSPVTRCQLDYGRLKGELLSASDMNKALILQALRLRINRALSSEDCLSVTSDYITNDLLGCSQNDTYHRNVIALLKSSSVTVCEQMCRLLNAFSSLASGRSYLAQSSGLVTALCEVLVLTGREWEGEGEGEGGGVEGNVAHNALGAVQKLSLRRPLQNLMVGCGLPQWVIGVIGRETAVSDYVLRYCLALLMNLSLRTAGRIACAEVGQSVLRTLGELLEHEDEEIRSYVNGILYSLLSLPQLQAEARGMGMGDMLSSALDASPPKLKSQLHYIITQLHLPSAVANDDIETPPSDDSADEEEEEDDEETDVIEGDEDEVAIATNGPVGEALLARYVITSSSHQMMSLKQIQEAPLMRPVTPHGRPASRAASLGRLPTQSEYGEQKTVGDIGGQSRRSATQPDKHT